ncbi:hypothetical protein Pelo_2906 [Pelomyxa schiedti]|nr:hypothetical protein Pelo_2906 [Pelomyxa schiedti]
MSMYLTMQQSMGVGQPRKPGIRMQLRFPVTELTGCTRCAKTEDQKVLMPGQCCQAVAGAPKGQQCPGPTLSIIGTAMDPRVQRVTWLSKLLWDTVLPNFLSTMTPKYGADTRPERHVDLEDYRNGWGPSRRKRKMSRFQTRSRPASRGFRECQDVVSLGEALFPLLPRACRLALGLRFGRPLCVLGVCAAAGAVRCAAWLARRHRVDGRAMLTSDNNNVLALACGAGRLDFARWLAPYFSGSYYLGADRGAYMHQLYAEEAFLSACAAGHLQVAEFLVGSIAYAPEAMRYTAARAVHFAAIKGYLPVVQWLVRRFDVDWYRLHQVGRDTLLDTIQAGHMETAKWLFVEARGPQTGTRLPAVCLALCSHRHWGFLQWIFDQVVKSPGLTQASLQGALHGASVAGDVATAKWVLEKLKSPNLPAYLQQEAMVALEKSSNLEVISFLAGAFNFGYDVAKRLDLALKIEANFGGGETEAEEWLMATFTGSHNC